MNNRANKYNIIVIGGGPAGMMAAGQAADSRREIDVAILLLLPRRDTQDKGLSRTYGREWPKSDRAKKMPDLLGRAL